MNIYVGNLSYNLSEPELKQAFEAHGEVSSVKIITDKFTGKAKGFAFVEMPNDEAGRKAISSLDGFDLKGRPLKVSEARPKDR